MSFELISINEIAVVNGDSVVFDSPYTITCTGSYSHLSTKDQTKCFIDYLSIDGKKERALVPVDNVYLVVKS